MSRSLSESSVTLSTVNPSVLISGRTVIVIFPEIEVRRWNIWARHSRPFLGARARLRHARSYLCCIIFSLCYRSFRILISRLEGWEPASGKTSALYLVRLRLSGWASWAHLTLDGHMESALFKRKQLGSFVPSAFGKHQEAHLRIKREF